MGYGELSNTQETMVMPLLQMKNIRGKPYITVSAKGMINGLSNIPNDGADFGPDTTKGAMAPGQYGSPYTQTSGLLESVDYMQSGMTLEIVGNLNLNGNQVEVNSKSIIIKGNGTTITNGSLWFLNCGREFNQAIEQEYVGGGALYDLNFDAPEPSGQPALRRTNCVGHNIYNINIYNFAQFGFIDETSASQAVSGVVSHVNNNVFGMQIGGGQDVAPLSQAAMMLQTNGTNGGDFGVNNNNYYGVNLEGNSNTASNADGLIFTYTISSGVPQLIGNHFYGLLVQGFFYGINFLHGTSIIIDDVWFEGNSNDIYMNAGVHGSVTTYASARIRFVEGFNGSDFTSIYDPPVIAGTPLNTYTQLVLEYTPIYPTPSISTNPPVSGTTYQNTNPYDIEIDLPVYATTSGTAGYVTIAKGSTSTPTAIGNQFVNGSTSSTSVDIIRLRVPAGWYYEFTASGVTFGTASVFAD